MVRRWLDDATLELFRPGRTAYPRRSQWTVSCSSCQSICTDVPEQVRQWHYVDWLCPDCMAEALRAAVLSGAEVAP